MAGIAGVQHVEHAGGFVHAHQRLDLGLDSAVHQRQMRLAGGQVAVGHRPETAPGRLQLALGKPLLLEGAPGVGKTEAAKAIAGILGRQLIRLQCFEGIDAAAALYEWNYPRQMLAIRQAQDGANIDIYRDEFLIERPMLTALRRPESTVLLIDEIDRSDHEFEAFLLEFLSDFSISIPERGTLRAADRPVVILTSNRTRDLHEALRRRCVYHYIAYPDPAREAAIIMLRSSAVAESTARAVVAAVGILRNEPLSKPPGVAEAVDSARASIAAVRRLPANRRGWPRTAAAAGIRAARASAMLDGGSAVVAMSGDTVMGTAIDTVPDTGADADPGSADGIVTDAILAGALRVSAAVGELASVWQRAPLQALARLHTLAAADMVTPERLGRPRPEPGVAARLAVLAEAVSTAPWSAPVLVAVVHGELLALQPFDDANGVVARAAARLAMVATGLDPQALTVPEVGYLRAGQRYRTVAKGFATGAPAAVAEWIRLVGTALQAGAREARSIATAATGGAALEGRWPGQHGHVGG